MLLCDFISGINKFSSEGIPFLFLIDFEMKKPFLCRLEETAGKSIFFDIKGSTNTAHKNNQNKVRINSKKPVSFTKYQKAFKTVQKNLHAGNTYLVNLTFPTEIETDFDLNNIFKLSAAPYKLLFKDSFVIFSPECFIKIENDKIKSFPMKGTIDASVPDAEKKILADEKESWEHNTIVDLIRNDISMVSENVGVKRFRFINRIRTPEKDLLQVSSEIEGQLAPGWQQKLGNILVNLLPAGSISGAPKKKTVEIIGEAEQDERGYYTGVFGIFDGKNLDSAVNIRFIEKTGDRYYFRSGGGITAVSNIDSEYQEMLDKVNVPQNS